MEKSKFFQGLWNFEDFEHYLNERIIPVILEDLDTLFTGAAEYWIKKGEPANGRGDFMLATALFSVFDHLGGFLAKSEKSPLQPLVNISRVVRRIPSVKNVDLIIAYFGRHALIHSAWPDTMFFVGQKAFSLNIYAYPDIGRCENCKGMHMFLYKKKYSQGSLNSSEEYEGVKLRINIHSLLKEFREQILNGSMFSDVKPFAFKRMEKAVLKSFESPLDANSLEKMFESKKKYMKGKEREIRVNKILIKQVSEQISMCKNEGVTVSCPIKNSEMSDN